jgi:hypothetical protein
MSLASEPRSPDQGFPLGSPNKETTAITHSPKNNSKSTAIQYLRNLDELARVYYLEDSRKHSHCRLFILQELCTSVDIDQA